MIKNPAKQTRGFRSNYTVEQYKKAVNAAYKLGLAEGRQKSKELFILLQETNHRLWEELIELDKKEPLNGITLSAKQARGLVRHLQKAGIEKHRYWVGVLKDKMEGLERSESEVVTAVAPGVRPELGPG